jgi:chaperonin GroES
MMPIGFVWRPLTMKTSIKPLNDRVVIERFAAEEKTSSGLYLPENAKSKPQKGKILAVGPGKLLKDGSRKQPGLKVGDIVLFTNWAGDEFKQSHGEDVLLMREEDVLAVVDG